MSDFWQVFIVFFIFYCYYLQVQKLQKILFLQFLSLPFVSAVVIARKLSRIPISCCNHNMLNILEGC